MAYTRELLCDLCRQLPAVGYTEGAEQDAAVVYCQGCGEGVKNLIPFDTPEPNAIR